MPIAASLLARPYPAALALTLAAWLWFLPAALGRLRRLLLEAKAGTAYLLVALVLGALALRLALPPAHQVYYDEFEHLDIARHVAEGVFAETTAGGLPGWDVLARPTWPGGHHVALGAVLRATGGGAGAAFAWSAVLSALTALFLVWAALELGAPAGGALAAGFLWAVCPVALRYAAACDTTSASLFWCAAALAALHARENEPGPALDAFAALTLAYAVQVRFENALLLPYAAAVLRRRSLLLPAAAGLVFPALIVLANRAEALPGFAARTPWADFARQAPADARWLLGPAALGVIASPAALLSAGRASSRRLLLLAAAFFATYASYYHGDFSKGTDDRYALSVLLPLTVAAAPVLATAAVPAAALAAGLAFRGPAAPDPEREAARRFLSGAAERLPENAVVVAFNAPFVRVVAGRPAAWSYLVLEDAGAFEKARAAAGAAPELALYKDWAWRARPAEAARLEALLAKDYEARTLADDGRDALVLLSPALRGRR